MGRQVLRDWGEGTRDNFQHVGKLQEAKSNIKDSLNEIITLDEIKIIFGEWIPMGANQIVALNDRLGSCERVKV